jgi:peptide methionine sulfoxide reductase MsrB
MRICRYIFVFVAALSALGRGALARQAAQERQGQSIPCSSDDGEKHYCAADTRHGARLVRQRSQAPCKQGESWGYDEEGIWVDKGCGGEFTLGRAEDGGDARGERGGGSITCASDDGRRKVCPADTSNGVQLVRQRSDAKCKEGSSWGHDTRGIWVDKGCDADFVVGVPGHPAGYGKAVGKSQKISCASFDGRKNYCEVDTQGAKVQLTRQTGTAPCMEGSTWGYDRRGVWVDRGCNGEFLVQAESELGAGDSSGKSCEKTVGKQVANELVRQCLQVSSATHSPCNSQNSCKLIEDEIQRGCGLLSANLPAFCGENK